LAPALECRRRKSRIILLAFSLESVKKLCPAFSIIASPALGILSAKIFEFSHGIMRSPEPAITSIGALISGKRSYVSWLIITLYWDTSACDGVGYSEEMAINRSTTAGLFSANSPFHIQGIVARALSAAGSLAYSGSREKATHSGVDGIRLGGLLYEVNTGSVVGRVLRQNKLLPNR